MHNSGRQSTLTPRSRASPNGRQNVRLVGIPRQRRLIQHGCADVNEVAWPGSVISGCIKADLGKSLILTPGDGRLLDSFPRNHIVGSGAMVGKATVEFVLFGVGQLRNWLLGGNPIPYRFDQANSLVNAEGVNHR